MPKGRYRVTDFVIHTTGIMYRDPYSFIYTDKPLGQRKSTNPLGYCPYHIQGTFENMLSSAKAYLVGNKYAKETFKRAMAIWKKKHRTPIRRQNP